MATLSEQLAQEKKTTRLKGFVNFNGKQINPECIAYIESSADREINVTVFFNFPKGSTTAFVQGYFQTIEEYQQFMSDVSAVREEILSPKNQRSNVPWTERGKNSTGAERAL